jgi:tetratricopeptide (TPR) repeat protein
MSREPSAPAGATPAADDLQPILEAARSQLGEAAVGGRVARLGRSLLRDAAGAGDYAGLRDRLDACCRELATLGTILAAARDRADQKARERAAAEPFGAAGWTELQRSLAAAFARGQDEGTRAWVAAWAQALTAGELDACRRLATAGQSALPDDTALVAELDAGAAALGEERLGEALPALQRLADGPLAAALAAATRVRLLVLLARALQRRDEPDEAGRRLEQAQAVWLAEDAAEPALAGLVATAAGELALHRGDEARAAERFTEALRLAPDDPAAAVGNGMLAERRQAWYQAKDWYEQAAAAGEDAVAGRLLAPAPANLYWQVARRLRKTRAARALELIERAIELGVTGEGSYPERGAQVDRGRILEQLGRPTEAAAAYHAAGRLFSWEGDQATARSRLLQACALDGSVPLYHWDLAEALRLLANRPDESVDRDLAVQARDAWEEGWRQGRPDAGTTWVYLTRALINLQLGGSGTPITALAWGAAGLVERALVLSGAAARSWAYLGMIHRGLGNPGTALAAAARSFELDPEDAVVIQERWLTLTALSRYEEAEAALPDLGKAVSPWWVEYARAFLRLRAGRAQEALELLEAQPAEDEVFLRWARAYAYQLLGRRDEALAEYRWILERDPDARRGPKEAWAAYQLGDYDAAEAAYRELLDTDLTQDPDVRRSLALARLARGDPRRRDLDEGADLLRQGIELTVDADELRAFAEIDLPELTRRVRDRPHAAEVDHVVSLARAQTAERRRALSAPPAPPAAEMRRALEQAAGRRERRDERLAALAALARMAADEGRPGEALDRYLDALGAGFEEAAAGLRGAAASLQDEADRLVGDGQVGQASSAYRRLLDAGEALADDRALLAGVQARAGLAALELGDTAAAREQLERAAEAPPDWGAVAEIFVCDVAAYWRHRDGLGELLAGGGLGDGPRAGVEALRDSLSLERVYRLRQADAADPSGASPLFPNPVVLGLGDDLVPEDTSNEWVLFRELLPAMRERVEADTGVRLPGVRVQQWNLPERDGYEAHLLGLAVVKGRAGAADRDGALDRIVGELEAALRDNLAYLLGVDDVGNWLRGSPQQTTVTEPRPGPAHRGDGLVESLLDLVPQILDQDRELGIWVATTRWPADPAEARRLIQLQMREDSNFNNQRWAIYQELLGRVGRAEESR